MTAFRTFSGSLVSYREPSPDAINIDEIAVALSRIPRFLGHTFQAYSVAQHCVLASRLCTDYPFHALMHDASEAYMGDCPRCLKDLLGRAWTDIETRLQAAIFDKFGIVRTTDAAAAVKMIDDMLLHAEAHYMFPQRPPYCDALPAFDGITRDQVKPWVEDQAYSEFIRQFQDVQRLTAGTVRA